MGYNILNNKFETENSLFDWNISIIYYQQDIIDHFLYTSRVHDLIELSIEGNKLPLSLLQRLKYQTDECPGNILENNNKTMEFARNENNAFIKLPLNIDSFIPLIQVRKIIGSDDRIYYIYLDNQNEITHSISWTNAFGPTEHRDWLSANHCQIGSNLLV